jgi:hypothetical protein
MKQKLACLILIAFLAVSCAEKEEPLTFFGEYHSQSIFSDIDIDITGNGIVSTDLLDQLENQNRSMATFLRLYSPEHFNVHFSQITMHIPFHSESANRIHLEFLLQGRRIDFEENGNVTISFNTYPNKFDSPKQIHKDIQIENIKSIQGKNSIIELDTSQRLYDFSKEEWVDVKVSYIFAK